MARATRDSPLEPSRHVGHVLLQRGKIDKLSRSSVTDSGITTVYLLLLSMFKCHPWSFNPFQKYIYGSWPSFLKASDHIVLLLTPKLSFPLVFFFSVTFFIDATLLPPTSFVTPSPNTLNQLGLAPHCLYVFLDARSHMCQWYFRWSNSNVFIMPKCPGTWLSWWKLKSSCLYRPFGNISCAIAKTKVSFTCRPFFSAKASLGCTRTARSTRESWGCEITVSWSAPDSTNMSQKMY